MKHLSFTPNCSASWERFKRYHQELFWEEMEGWRRREIKKLLEARIEDEFEEQIGAGRYERTAERRDERNGYRYRSYEIQGGVIEEIRIPRARQLDIRFGVFEKWERVQPRVVGALTTAYLMGRSAASAAEIAEAFGQSRFSRSYLQKLIRVFEERLKAYRERQIEKIWPYIYIDGMSVKVRDVRLKEKLAIFAYGMNEKREHELLGWVVADSEDEIAVRGLLLDLKNRGLKIPSLFISDDSKGIRAALRLEYPHVPWQMCSFHKIKNINDHLSDTANRKAIMRDAGDIYKHSRTKREAIERFTAFKVRWRRKEPEAVRLFSLGFADTLTYFQFPEQMWVTLRTNNPIEQFIGKMRVWTSRFGYFQGRANLDLALFTFIDYRMERGVSQTATFLKPTLSFA